MDALAVTLQTSICEILGLDLDPRHQALQYSTAVVFNLGYAYPRRYAKASY
jgi:hypothetical protein